jgi:hypothetical protein
VLLTAWSNAITERWIGGCRRELLDRTLIWNQRYLMTVLPRVRGLLQHAPAAPRPEPGSVTDLDHFGSSGVTALAASSTNITWWHRVFGTHAGVGARPLRRLVPVRDRRQAGARALVRLDHGRDEILVDLDDAADELTVRPAAKAS